MSKLTVDPHNIFIQADSFSKAVAQITSSPGPFDEQTLLTPAVVNSVFALELYFKCLLALETGSFPRGHSIKTLFNSLSQNAQGEVSIRYQQLLDSHQEELRAMAAVDRRMEHRRIADNEPATIYPGVALEDTLEACKNAFQRLRYSFEPSEDGIHVKPYLLNFIQHSIRETILGIQPDWRNIIRKPSKEWSSITGVTDAFKQVIQRESPKMEFGAINFGCPTNQHGFCLGFTLVSNKNHNFPKYKNNRLVLMWPKDDLFTCPDCGTTADIGLLREYIEQYTGKQIQEAI
jgi:HEPN domain-containing protein